MTTQKKVINHSTARKNSRNKHYENENNTDKPLKFTETSNKQT